MATSVDQRGQGERVHGVVVLGVVLDGALAGPRHVERHHERWRQDGHRHHGSLEQAVEPQQAIDDDELKITARPIQMGRRTASVRAGSRREPAAQRGRVAEHDGDERCGQGRQQAHRGQEGLAEGVRIEHLAQPDDAAADAGQDGQDDRRRTKVPTVSLSGGRCPLARMTTTVTRMKKTNNSWPIRRWRSDTARWHRRHP